MEVLLSFVALSSVLPITCLWCKRRLPYKKRDEELGNSCERAIQPATSSGDGYGSQREHTTPASQACFHQPNTGVSTVNRTVRPIATPRNRYNISNNSVAKPSTCEKMSREKLQAVTNDNVISSFPLTPSKISTTVHSGRESTIPRDHSKPTEPFFSVTSETKEVSRSRTAHQAKQKSNQESLLVVHTSETTNRQPSLTKQPAIQSSQSKECSSKQEHPSMQMFNSAYYSSTTAVTSRTTANSRDPGGTRPVQHPDLQTNTQQSMVLVHQSESTNRPLRLPEESKGECSQSTRCLPHPEQPVPQNECTGPDVYNPTYRENVSTRNSTTGPITRIFPSAPVHSLKTLGPRQEPAPIPTEMKCETASTRPQATPSTQGAHRTEAPPTVQAPPTNRAPATPIFVFHQEPRRSFYRPEVASTRSTGGLENYQNYRRSDSPVLAECKNDHYEESDDDDYNYFKNDDEFKNDDDDYTYYSDEDDYSYNSDDDEQNDETDDENNDHRSRESNPKAAVLDLRGLIVREAVAAVKTFLPKQDERYIESDFDEDYRFVYIITGWGKLSPGRKPRLKPAVQNLFDHDQYRLSYEYTWTNAGELEIDLVGRKREAELRQRAKERLRKKAKN